MISLELPPTTVQLIHQHAAAQGLSVEEWAAAVLTAHAQVNSKNHTASDGEQAYYDWFHRHHYDVEMLTQAIGETDENGRAKHTVAVPKGLAKDKAAFRAWLKAGL